TGSSWSYRKDNSLRQYRGWVKLCLSETRDLQIGYAGALSSAPFFSPIPREPHPRAKVRPAVQDGFSGIGILTRILHKIDNLKVA
ncbi:MAG: hypothetical protein ACLP2X_11420, partial [Syntrophobacteraceae bacterium]